MLMVDNFSIWISGLSGSGKTTLARALKTELGKKLNRIKVLDGDEVRQGLCRDLGFSLQDRKENIRRVAEVNKLFLNEGFLVINAFISPTNEIRQYARSIIGGSRFFEIHLNTPVQVCKARDPKGLYKRIQTGRLKDFSGIDAIFETSDSADITLNTAEKSVGECVDLVVESIMIRSQLSRFSKAYSK